MTVLINKMDTTTYSIVSYGSFTNAERNMTAKASKALFKRRSLLNDTHISPTIALTLFDQLIKPIALYGSEL